MPDPEFGWDQAPEDLSGYITVDPRVLKALRELLWIDLVDKYMQPVLRLVLQVVSIDPITGTLVIEAKLVRDLGDDQ